MKSASELLQDFKKNITSKLELLVQEKGVPHRNEIYVPVTNAIVGTPWGLVTHINASKFCTTSGSYSLWALEPDDLVQIIDKI